MQTGAPAEHRGDKRRGRRRCVALVRVGDGKSKGTVAVVVAPSACEVTPMLPRPPLRPERWRVLRAEARHTSSPDSGWHMGLIALRLAKRADPVKSVQA